MRRSLALIAVAVAVAVAAAVVVVGRNSGDGGETAGASTASQNLPSGHPSIAAADTEDPASDGASGENIAQLEAQRAKDPSNVKVLLDLGDAYFMGQRLRQAQQTYDEVLAKEPDNATAQVGLAMVWHAQGDSRRAETSLLKVVEAHPDDQQAHYSLAIVYFSGGRISEAKREWQTAASIDPTSTTGRRSQSFVDLLKDAETATPAAQ